MKMKSSFSLLACAQVLGVTAQTVAEANKYTEREQFEKAASAYRLALQTTPNSGEAWFYFGENYFYSDKADSAELCYDKGLGAEPQFPLNRVGLGKVKWTRGDRESARALFDQAIAIASDKAQKLSKSAQALVLREAAESMVYGQAKDIPTALQWIEKAIALNPKDPEVFILKGDAVFELNTRDATDAVANYQQAINLDPLSAKPVSRKAFMYYRSKNFPASVEAYSAAIVLDKDFAPAYRGRAEAYFMARDFDKATMDMDTYLRLNTGNTTARVRNAQFLYLVKKYDESLAEIQNLETKGVQNNTLNRIKGYALAEKGRFDEARASMDLYFKDQPVDKVISTDWEYMGKIFQGLATPAVPATPALPGAPPVPQPMPLAVNYDSLAAEMYVKAARMDANKCYLFIDACTAFGKAKCYARAADAVQEKVNTCKAELNDWYYLGDAANKAKRYALGDSAWTNYANVQKNIYQGYLGRARANVGLDSAKVTWQAKPWYEEVVRKMKPEETAKAAASLEEAYFYLGCYYLYKEKNMPSARCYFDKIKVLNAGTSNTKVSADLLLSKELKDVPPATCDLAPTGP
jgi:tetratricopeptide (TPR) repeat protein